MAVERERVFSGDRDRWEEDDEGTLRRDDQVLFEVQEALHAHPDVDATHVVVQVRSCEVTLSGSVPDPRHRPLAEACARNVDGVTEVHDLLTVATPEPV